MAEDPKPGDVQPDPEEPKVDPVVVDEPTKPPPGHVPIRALQDERLKRQTLETQFVEAQKLLAMAQGELRGRAATATPARQKITADDVLKAYTAGQITETEKDRALYTLSKTEAKDEAKAEIIQSFRVEQSTQAAHAEVIAYIAAVPALKDRESREWHDLSARYQRLLERGMPDNETTQSIACESAFGPLDRLQGRPAAERGTRESSTFTEISGDRRPSGDGGKPDPLKNIPKVQIDYWRQMGYSKEQMIAEAPYYREHRRGRA